MTSSESKTSFTIRTAYGVGGIPIGVIQNGIAFFLLIYYNQVLGLDPALTALALSLALMVDAISDPLTGFLSDNMVSRLGRRHPFIFAAAIPTGIMYYAIWNPPEFSSEAALFWYLLATVIALRISNTFFDVPHNALIPELTNQYHERTILTSQKVAYAQLAGYFMVLAMYGIWLVPTDIYPDGILNPEGYKTAGLVGAVIISLTMLLAGFGLLSRVNQLREFIHDATYSYSAMFSQMTAAFKVPSFNIIMVSGVINAVGIGLYLALWVYVMNYYWALSSEQTFYILIANFIGMLIGISTTRMYLTKQDKKTAAITLSIVSLVVAALPYMLRFSGQFPENGTDALFWSLFAHGIAMIIPSIWLQIVSASMTADIVEHGAVKSGFQIEGIILAATTFTVKAGTAGGLIISGSILAIIGFPDQATSATLSDSTINDLGFYFVASTSVLYILSTIALIGYSINKEIFEEASLKTEKLKQV